MRFGRSHPPYRKFTYLGVLLFLVGAVFGNQGLVTLYRLHRLEKGIERSNQEMKRRNQELALEIQHLKDPMQLERVIRNELNMVRVGEVVFIVE